jgi:Fic family protein
MAIIEKSITDLKLVQAEVITKQKLEEKMEFKGLTINQKQVLRTLSQQETPYFTSADWAAVAGYSKDTALREIRTLLNLRLIQKLSHGGRSTRYRIAN